MVWNILNLTNLMINIKHRSEKLSAAFITKVQIHFKLQVTWTFRFEAGLGSLRWWKQSVWSDANLARKFYKRVWTDSSELGWKFILFQALTWFMWEKSVKFSSHTIKLNRKFIHRIFLQNSFFYFHRFPTRNENRIGKAKNGETLIASKIDIFLLVNRHKHCVHWVFSNRALSLDCINRRFIEIKVKLYCVSREERWYINRLSSYCDRHSKAKRVFVDFGSWTFQRWRTLKVISWWLNCSESVWLTGSRCLTQRPSTTTLRGKRNCVRWRSMGI